MKKSLDKWKAQFEARAPRERLILLLVVAIVLFFFWDRRLAPPLRKSYAGAVQGMAQVQGQIAQLQDQQRQVLERAKVDPDADIRKQLAVLDGRIATLDGRLAQLTVDFIPPVYMVQALREILRQEDGLALLELTSLSPVPLLEKEEEATDAQGEEGVKDLPGNIYKHGVKMSLQGDFFATVRFLRRLEGLSWRFYWESLDFQVKEHPLATVTITVHTLSLSEAWLGV